MRKDWTDAEDWAVGDMLFDPLTERLWVWDGSAWSLMHAIRELV